MKWFKEHLNWTLVIGVTVIEIPLMVYIFTSIDPELAFWYLMPTLVAELSLQVWYLYQKKRNYVYLLLNFIKPLYIPVGFILLLCLSNKRVNP